MLLGAIASLRHQPQWEMTLVVSVPTAEQLKGALTEALKGKHTVRFNDANLATINIDDVAIADEGQGVVIQASPDVDTKGQTLLYDFGYGTTIMTLFNCRKKVDRRVLNQGVKALVESIATSGLARSTMGYDADPMLVMQGIERGDFVYGNPTRQASWSFESAYREELRPWVQSVIAQVMAMSRDWAANCDSIIATGGGSQLPLINQLLLKNDITPVPDGCWSNARGLARLAFMKQRRAS